ncbi:GDSL esterase/lipase APG-like [Impatiens glandulifera]|uniref:GDSL esterase/lipase APG-like n=1 Tax=Impatiens glandulifera TaxID=253017 RepID=UPI001FB1063C|nr:GDSL esterase/lipase APG-like [Impatiens glandulifera]
MNYKSLTDLISAVGAVILMMTIITIDHTGNSQALVPAIMTFGDSSVDVGNNNYIHTIFKANHPPYGRDFINRRPTGRFCNGKLATDLTADTLGFKTYPKAYLSPEASGKNLFIGANFASAGSGYDVKTSKLSHAIPLSQQLEYYKEYQSKLRKVAGNKKAESIIKDGLYLVSSGNSDFVQNYYVNPLLKLSYSPQQYSSYLVNIFYNFVKDLYGLGARKIGVTSLPPLGCLPVTITLFGHHEETCVERMNNDAQDFNSQMKSAVASLKKELRGLKIAVFDIYKPLYDLIRIPSDHGFAEARKGCCGTGTIETTSLLCHPKSVGTCRNATEYIFWDSVHPSQSTNQILAESLIAAGIELVG